MELAKRVDLIDKLGHVCAMRVGGKPPVAFFVTMVNERDPMGYFMFEREIVYAVINYCYFYSLKRSCSFKA